MTEGAKPGGLNPRAFLVDQSWALFVTGAEGVPMEKTKGRIQTEQQRIADEIEGPLFQEGGRVNQGFVERYRESAASRLANRLLHEVAKMWNSDEKCAELTESGVYVNWTGQDHTIHDAWLVRNITEAQAARIADAVGIKYWAHSKAFHEGKERIPLDLEDAHFFNSVSVGDLPEKERELIYREGGTDSGVSLEFEGRGLSENHINKLKATDERFKNAVGMMMIVFIGPQILGWSRKRWPGASFEERGERIRSQLSAWEAAGWTSDEMLEKMGLQGHIAKLTTALVLKVKEE